MKKISIMFISLLLVSCYNNDNSINKQIETGKVKQMFSSPNGGGNTGSVNNDDSFKIN